MSSDPHMRLYAADELGADGYPPEWHATVKHAVRDEAGHRCVRCLHPYRRGEHGRGEWSRCDDQCTHGGPTWVAKDGWAPRSITHNDATRRLDHVLVGEGATWAQWRILTVHHLDGVKGNCRWWNLAALCQRCHLQIQGKVQMARVWPWEHTEWFRPYVAGYYAHVYLAEDLTRAEVDARLDELLDLERQVA